MWELLKNSSLFWGQNNINKKFLCTKNNIKTKKIKDSKMEKVIEKSEMSFYFSKNQKKRKIERKEFKDVKMKIKNAITIEEQIDYMKKDYGLEKQHLQILMKHENVYYKTVKTSVDSVEKFIDIKGKYHYENLKVDEGFVTVHEISEELAEVLKDKNNYENIDLEKTKHPLVNKIKKNMVIKMEKIYEKIW